MKSARSRMWLILPSRSAHSGRAVRCPSSCHRGFPQKVASASFVTSRGNSPGGGVRPGVTLCIHTRVFSRPWSGDEYDWTVGRN